MKCELVEPKRFDDTGDRRRVIEHPHGRYVLSTDYDALRTALEEARRERDEAVSTMEALRKGWEANYQSAAFRAESAERQRDELQQRLEHLGNQLARAERDAGLA